jgi:LCP family protein required for cell wall assembly
MTLYAPGRRSRWRLAGKIVTWLFVLVLVAAGALGGGVWLYLNESVAAVQAHSAEVKEIEREGILDAPVPGQPTNAIIIGYDSRKGEEADPGRSDTVMLLRADPQRDALTLLSFPRDLVVDHPGCPNKGHGPFRDRINVAYTLCGPVGTVKTVKQLTGVPINYAIVVNFHAFKEIVNAVGGVYVDVDRRYFNDNSAGTNYARINLQPGYQKLTGGAALDYARFRHTDSDFHRIARQQAFVKAFKQRVQTSFSVFKLPGVINSIVENVEVVKGGKKTKISVEEVIGYARFVYDLPSGHFYQAHIDGITGFAELSASTESVEGAVRDFINPDVEAAEKATQIASGGKPKDSAPKPADTTILVLNGNGVEGAADTAAYLLEQRAYDARPGGNADPEGDGVPNYDYFQTEVVYDPALTGAEAAARAVAALFGNASVVEATPETEIDTMLKVIVGQTFHGTIADAPVDDTPEHQPPAVTRDFDDVVPLLREARRKVSFPLLVPTLRESSSTIDSEVPVRAYRIEGYEAVRIVYRTSSGRYWGVQQTSWADAPLLTGASVERRIAGRAYSLYYEGSKLHTVAFEESGAAYWVSNTLLNELSNETMLAIAKGLRPLAAV